MNTAQLSAQAPKFMTEIKPTLATSIPSQGQPRMQPQVVAELPVKNPIAFSSPTFKPVMSAESNIPQSPAVAQNNYQPTAKHTHQQPVTATAATPVNQQSLLAINRKPVLETILIISLCLVACATVLVVLGRR